MRRKGWGLCTALKINSQAREMVFVEYTVKVWNIVHKKFNSNLKVNHSSSMKEFQHSHPNLQDWAGVYDVLLLDKAQNMNPFKLAVFLQQKVPKIVVVGQHQQIYSFRELQLLPWTW